MDLECRSKLLMEEIRFHQLRLVVYPVRIRGEKTFQVIGAISEPSTVWNMKHEAKAQNSQGSWKPWYLPFLKLASKNKQSWNLLNLASSSRVLLITHMEVTFHPWKGHLGSQKKSLGRTWPWNTGCLNTGSWNNGWLLLHNWVVVHPLSNKQGLENACCDDCNMNI